MHHDIPLISTTAMAFVVACLFGFTAHRLRLPPLVGYLLAGVAIGPFSPGFVADSELAGQLAEMGVLLLMFGVGLHFSIGDLMAVRWIAVPGAIGQIAIATAMGMGLAMAWGWSLGAGLVFGLSLSVASTIVLLRALEDPFPERTYLRPAVRGAPAVVDDDLVYTSEDEAQHRVCSRGRGKVDLWPVGALDAFHHGIDRGRLEGEDEADNATAVDIDQYGQPRTTKR